MLTLKDVAREFGPGVSTRQAKARIRQLEHETGRRILVPYGAPNNTRARRHLVNAEELSAAMNGKAPEPISEPDPEPSSVLTLAELTNHIADAINKLNERMDEQSLRLERTQKQVDEVTRHFRSLRVTSR